MHMPKSTSHLSPTSPHRGTLGISPLMKLTPCRSFRDFVFDGMHAIRNILHAIFVTLGGVNSLPPRHTAYAELLTAWTDDNVPTPEDPRT